MDLNEKAQEAIMMIDAQLTELLSIKNDFKQKKVSSADGLEKMEAWKEHTIELLSQKVHPNEGLNLERKNEWLFSEDPLTTLRNLFQAFSIQLSLIVA